MSGDKLYALSVPGGAIDIIGQSFEAIMVMTFPKSRGSSYEAVANFAAQADQHECVPMDKAEYHIAAFGRTERQAALALAILMAYSSKNALQIISNGKFLPDHYKVQRALQCYIESCSCADHRAHCTEMVHRSHLVLNNLSAPFDKELEFTLEMDLSRKRDSGTDGDVVTFPCRFVRERGFKFQPRHPASDADQIQAFAVREGCNWCPNFEKELV